MRALVVLALLALAGCRSGDSAAPRPSVERPLPPAPAALIAELTVVEPAALYATLLALSGPGSGLPSSPALALMGALDLPIGVASTLVLDRPLFGAVVAEEGAASPPVVLALRTRSGAELVSALSTGTNPERHAEHDAALGLTLLTGGLGPALAVADDWLLVSSSVAAIRTAGAYVARALPARPLPKDPITLDVGRAALRGSLDRLLRAQWDQLRARLVEAAHQAEVSHGRPADFGDPATYLDQADAEVAKAFELLETSERLHATLNPQRSHVELVIEVEPTPGGSADASIRALTVRPLAVLLTLPRDAVLGGLLGFGSAECGLPAAGPSTATDAGAATTRWLSLPGVKEAMQLIGKSLSRVLDAGDGTTLVALLANRSWVMRRDVREPAEAERAVAELALKARSPLVAAALSPKLGPLTLRDKSGTPAGLPNAHGVELVEKGASVSKGELWWTVRDDALLVGGGADAREALAKLVAPAAEQLAADQAMAELVARHLPASVALVENVASTATADRVGPGFLGWGRHEQRFRLELEVPAGALAWLGGWIRR